MINANKKMWFVLAVALIAWASVSGIASAQNFSSTYTPTSPDFAAFERIGDIDTPGPNPFDASWQLLPLADMYSLAALDANYKETRLTSARWQYDYQLYRFRISQTVGQIASIDTTWYGYGEDQPEYDCYYYMWNYTSEEWELLSKEFSPLPDGVLQGSMDALTLDLADYVDTNGFVYTMARAQHYNYPPDPPVLISPANGTTIAYNGCVPGLSSANQVDFIISPVPDPDNDVQQFYYEVIQSNATGGQNSGWVTEDQFEFTLTAPNSTGNQNIYYNWRARTRDGIAESIFTGYWSFTLQWVPNTSGTFGVSCPYVFVHDGSKYSFVTETVHGCIDNIKANPNLLVPRYIPLTAAVPSENGSYMLKVRESLAEISYSDEYRLIVAEAPEGCEIYSAVANGVPMDESFKFFTVRSPRAAVSAKIGSKDVTESLSKKDSVLAPMMASGETVLELDFGKVNDPSNAKLVFFGWNIDNVFTAESQSTPYAEVSDGKGGWRKACDIGIYYGELTYVVADLSKAGMVDGKVRISGISASSPKLFRIDSVEFDDSEPVKVTITETSPDKASLYYRGRCDKEFKADESRSRSFEDTAIDPMPGSQLYGSFTKYGEVGELLTSRDDKFVVMRCGDELLLTFKPKPSAGSNRRVFLKADVVYKTFAAGQTSEPLPHHNMEAYPSENPNMASKEYTEYAKNFNTRTHEQPVLVNFLPKAEPELKPQPEKKIPRSLNSNHVQLVINYQGAGPPSTPKLLFPADKSVGISTAEDFFWDPSYGTTPIAYQIQIALTNDFAYPVKDVTAIADPFAKDITGLSIDKQHFWRVRASNAYGTSGWSDVWSFDTAQAPSVPETVSPTDGASGVSLSTTFDWDASIGFQPITYDVQIATDALFTDVFSEVEDLTDTKWVAYGLIKNSFYYWRVRAHNSAGTSDWSNSSSYWFFQTGIPPVAPNLSSPLVALTDISIPPTLIWSAPSEGSNPLLYMLQVSSDANFTTTVLSLSELKTTAYTFANAQGETSYYWRVKASNTVGDSGWSSPWYFVTAPVDETVDTTTPPPTDTTGPTEASGEAMRKCFLGGLAGASSCLAMAFAGLVLVAGLVLRMY